MNLAKRGRILQFHGLIAKRMDPWASRMREHVEIHATARHSSPTNHLEYGFTSYAAVEASRAVEDGTVATCQSPLESGHLQHLRERSYSTRTFIESRMNERSAETKNLRRRAYKANLFHQRLLQVPEDDNHIVIAVANGSSEPTEANISLTLIPRNFLLISTCATRILCCWM